jgi:23S rRNA (adenine2503-C2)-methyltransferase
MTDHKVFILDLNYSGLKEFAAGLGQKPFRADQILKWIYQLSADSFAEMSDLPLELRQKLEETSFLSALVSVEEKVAADQKTRKMLFQMRDGKTIETTLMLYANTGSGRERRTVCVSTQVGCPMGCVFCATGQQGFERNLSPGEIIEQILFYANWVKKVVKSSEAEITRNAITNIVFMGMGEPLANYENVHTAVEMLNSKHGLQLGARQITLSTAGIVPGIRRLTEERWPIELAVSLHAATNELRNKLMPVNRTYPLEDLIPACREYLEKTGRRPTFEYALFQGVNDSLENANQLAALLKGLNCSVNIIVGNPTPCQEFRSSGMNQALIFQKHLFAGGIFNTIRNSRGTDIDAGCGQLRSRFIEKSSR